MKQDHVGRRDIPRGKIHPRKWPVMAERTYLTKRENQICTFLAVGLTRVEIAKTLRIKPSTVRSHIRNLKKKMHDSCVR